MFKFSLINDALGSYELRTAPAGWDGLISTLRRSKEYHGIAIEYTVDLDFLKDGRDFIQAVYNSQGIEGFIRIMIYELDTLNNTWEEAYTGRLNLSKVKIGEIKSSTNIEQAGLAQQFLNLDDVAVSLQSLVSVTGTALPAFANELVAVPLHSQRIEKRYEAWVAQGQPYSSMPAITDAPQRDATISFGFDDVKVNELKAFTYGSGFSLEDNVFEIIKTTEKGPFILDFKIDAELRALLADGDYEGIQIDYFYRVNDNAPVNVLHYRNTNVQGSYTGTHTAQKTVTLNLEIGDKVYVYGRMQTFDVSEFGYDFEYIIQMKPTSYIKITGLTETNPTTAKGMLAHEYLSRLFASVTGNPLALYSEYYGRTDSEPRSYAQDGPGSLRMFTNGFALRNFDLAQKPITTEVKDAYSSLAAIDNIGIGFEVIEGRQVLRLEGLDYFYSTEAGLKLGIVKDLIKRPATERIYTQVEVGYEKWQTEDYGGLDEINSRRKYTLPITQLKNIYKAVSKYIAAGYVIESVRRDQYIDAATKDNKNDNDIFIICLVRSAGGYVTHTSQGISMQGTANPDTKYNAAISPTRMLRKHEKAIKGGLVKYQNKPMAFDSGEGNYTASTQMAGEGSPLAENRAPLIKQLEGPIWADNVYEFTHPLANHQLRYLRENPYKIITFMDSNYNLYKGWLVEVKSNRSTKATDWVLIEKYEG